MTLKLNCCKKVLIFKQFFLYQMDVQLVVNKKNTVSLTSQYYFYLILIIVVVMFHFHSLCLLWVPWAEDATRLTWKLKKKDDREPFSIMSVLQSERKNEYLQLLNTYIVYTILTCYSFLQFIHLSLLLLIVFVEMVSKIYTICFCHD